MNLPCMITSIRILTTALMLFTMPFSGVFYAIYTIAGITDIADGYVARKTNQITEFGARLDSIADIVFYSVMVYKIFPVLWDKAPIGLWCFAFAIVFVRLLSYIVAAVKHKCFTALHTYMNKFTGFLFFLIPYTIRFDVFIAFCVLTCIVGAVASVEELIIHIKGKSYNPQVKSLLYMT